MRNNGCRDARDDARPVWKSKFYGAFVLNRRVVLHAIDATPARWRGDANSSPLDRNDLVKNCRVHPTHMVDFHTAPDANETPKLPIAGGLSGDDPSAV